MEFALCRWDFREITTGALTVRLNWCCVAPATLTAWTVNVNVQWTRVTAEDAGRRVQAILRRFPVITFHDMGAVR